MAAENSKLRILAIHGYRQSEKTFSGKLGSLRKAFKSKADFSFIRAPHLVPPLETISVQEEPALQGYGWWFNTEDRYFKATEPSDMCVGFDQSLTHIEKTYREDGPFDGILGFSQGAAFVALLCSMQQKQRLSSMEFKFAILISGFESLCKPSAFLYNEQLTLPTLHVYGQTDQIVPTAMSKRLADLFEDKKVFIHEGGHYVPGQKKIYSDFIDDMLASKRATYSV